MSSTHSLSFASPLLLVTGSLLAACGGDSNPPVNNTSVLPAAMADAGGGSGSQFPPIANGNGPTLSGNGDNTAGGNGVQNLAEPDAGYGGAGNGAAGSGGSDEPDSGALGGGDIVDAGLGSDAGGTTPAGTCGGTTPHGCYTPHADNPAGCGPQIFEQSAYYPPLTEWKGCGAVQPYQTCNYDTPDGKLASCTCDTGLHWLCTYP